jgi:ATP-dependent protease ClpP protease subunit
VQNNRPGQIQIPSHTPVIATQRFFAKGRGQQFEARKTEAATQIDLYDEIGDFGVSAKDFRTQLKNAGDIVLRINSPGGDVFDGLAMYNDLVAHSGHVRVEVTGIAASAASIIAMAGDEIAIAENAFLMIHNSWGVTIGNQADHDEAADLLGQVDQSLAATYAKRTGLDARVVSKMMADETWFNGKEAKAKGFATEVITAEIAKAHFDLSVYSKAPTELTEIDPSIDPTDINIRELEKILRDAGIPRRKAKAIASSGNKATADLRDAEDDASDLADYFAAKATTIQISMKELN